MSPDGPARGPCAVVRRPAARPAVRATVLGILAAAACARGTAPPSGTRDDSGPCAACHAESVDDWRDGPHHALDCAACHGPPGGHLEETIDPRPRLATRGPALCLECHLRRPGEPETPARIDGPAPHLDAVERSHALKVDRAHVGDGCVFCHDPHVRE